MRPFAIVGRIIALTTRYKWESTLKKLFGHFEKRPFHSISSLCQEFLSSEVSVDSDINHMPPEKIPPLKNNPAKMSEVQSTFKHLQHIEGVPREPTIAHFLH